MKELCLSGAHGWVKHRLKDVFTFSSGDTISADDIHDLDDVNCYPVYGGNGIRGYYSKFNSAGSYPLIGRQGALCGNVNFASEKFWATEHAVRVKGKKLVSIRWAMRLLEDMDLNQYATQSAQPGLSVEKVKPLYVFVPPVSEQKAIAYFLDREAAIIDKRLALIAKKRALLSELKKSVIHEAVTKGLDKSVAMKDSGVEWIGEIPVGWNILRLKNVSQLQNGDWGSEPDRESPGMVCYRKADYSNGEVIGGATRRVIDRKPFVQMNDILIEKAGGGDLQPVGSVAIVKSDELAACSNFISRVRAKAGVYPEFLYFLLSAQYNSPNIFNLFKQTTGIQNLEIGKFMAIKLPFPSLGEQRVICNELIKKARRLENMDDLLIKQGLLLKEQRQALIHEVVTGKRRVI